MAIKIDLIGRLTGYRCRHCGSCMYLNNDGAFWCSSCDYRSHTMYDDISKYVFVQVPKDHPHVELFGPHILHGTLSHASQDSES